MASKTFHGSCHCQKVRFEVDLDLRAGAFKCNCTRCAKARFWAASVKSEAFRLLTGESDLSIYNPGSEGMFCKHCGVFIGGRAQSKSGDWIVAVNLAALDEVDPRVWQDVPIRYMDGRNDRWDREPEVTFHL